MPKANKLSVGDELRARREELGYSLHKVEVATKIRGHYLRAIEASDFTQLPNDVYSRGFVRQYAHYLGMPAADLGKRYQAERGGLSKVPRQVKPRAMALRLGATSRWAASLAVLAILVVVVGYLLWQFSSLTSAPKLDVYSPSQDQVVNTASIEIKGETAPGADVFLNNVPLPSDVNGGFTTTLILQPGINEVRIVAKNKLGKQTVVAYTVLSKSTVQTLPTATFNGVAVLLTAADASKVTIAADGAQVYDGSLSKGSSKLITATKRITIMASDAAALTAQVTNSQVSRYNVGKLGSASTATTAEFSKETNFTR